MNTQRNTPTDSLWSSWTTLRILALAALLLAADFSLQLMAFAAGGGLFIPVMLGSLIGVCLPLYFIAHTYDLPLRRDFSLHRPAPITLFTAALIALAALQPTSLLARLSLRLHPADPQWLSLMADNMPRSPLTIAIAFAAVIGAAPLAEELIFRGLLHRLAARYWGFWPAAAVSSLAFGVIHSEPWYVFGLIGVGFILALIYEATGSVLACWVTHGVYNGVSLAMMLWTDQATAETLPLTAKDGLWAVGCVILLVGLFRFLWSTTGAAKNVAPSGH